ncbi:hypothetical protein B0H66DRAFT_536787 [Apodospora peruviana]|uniref:Uncharacterized protein n=1 Tax=Apodospora peruviana TaxID=516989 RepID=A0AAE0HV99_9PEZI|nr:hypothetical protein B0H66DRAFT_536787 [Apodospora peruviana]
MPAEFVTLHQEPPGRPSTPNRNTRIPPPPLRPLQQGGQQGGHLQHLQPGVVNAAPHPAEMQQLQRQAPPPQHHMVPQVFQSNPPVRISDIRKERITPAEAREELSEYIIYRFEPSEPGCGYDSDGERRKPSWESVFVVEVHGVSKKDAALQVRTLNQNTWSLGEKKATLSGVQNRQIEKVLEELQARDYPYFQTNLVQIHHQLRPKLKEKHLKGSSSKHHPKDVKELLFRDHKERMKHSSSKDKKKHKEKEKEKERVSLTAYYKRSPKPEVDALAIYHLREASLRARLAPPPNPHMMAGPPEHHHVVHAPEGVHGKGAGDGGGRNGGGNGNKYHTGGRGAVAAVVHPHGDRKHDRRGSPRSPRSPTSSDSSFFSDTFSNEGDDMSIATPNSEDSFFSRGRRASFDRPHPRKQGRYLEDPAHFGVRHHNDHRGRREIHRISDEFLPRRSSLQRLTMAPPPPVDIEQIKSSAYAAGRADEREDVKMIAEKIAVASVSAIKPCLPTPPPRILQRRPSIRLVHAGDLSRESETAERLERLDLRDQALEDARYRLGDTPQRRLVGREGHLRRDEIWEEERAPRRRLDEALEYMRRTEAGADMPFMDNPFTPLPTPGIGRRASVAGPAPEFRRRHDFDDHVRFI